MSPSDQINRYETLMERLAGTYRGHMIKICKIGDLTPPQFWALHTIRDAEKIKMSPLADLLGLSMGAASTLIDRLVGRGLVAREADAHDRRAVFVSLTEKGREVLQEAAAAKRELSEQVFTRLTPEAREQLIGGLESLVSALEALTQGEHGEKSLGCVGEEV
jgi:DNA-binding MarR family transcriptional regulator